MFSHPVINISSRIWKNIHFTGDLLFARFIFEDLGRTFHELFMALDSARPQRIVVQLRSTEITDLPT